MEVLLLLICKLTIYKNLQYNAHAHELQALLSGSSWYSPNWQSEHSVEFPGKMLVVYITFGGVP